MPVSTDIKVTIAAPSTPGDTTHGWLFGGDADTDPRTDFSNPIASVPLGVQTTVPQAAFGSFAFAYARAVNGPMPVTVPPDGAGYNASAPSDWVELPTGPSAVWRDTFTAADNTRISDHAPEAGGAYDVSGDGTPDEAFITSNMVRSGSNNDCWFTVADANTGLISRVRALVPNNTGSTTHQVAVVIRAGANTNGLDAYGMRVNYLTGGFDIIQLVDGAVTSLAGGTGGYTGDDGNAFWQQIEYYLDPDNANAPTLRGRIIRASDEAVLGEQTHVLGGALSAGDAGLWMTNSAGRIDTVEGYL